MTNIITIQELLASMPRISTELTDEQLRLAIADAEDFYLRPRFGDTQWLEWLDNPAAHEVEIEGGRTEDGKVLAGLKQAEVHIVYAHLLYDNLYVSAFGSVRKKDDYSEHPSREDIYRLCHYHWTLGNAYVRELAQYLGLKWEPWNDVANNFFSEFPS